MSDNFKSAERPESKNTGGWIEYAVLKFWRDCLSRDEYIAELADDELATLRAQLAEAREGLTEANEIMSVARHLNMRAYRAWVDKYYKHLVNSA